MRVTSGCDGPTCSFHRNAHDGGWVVRVVLHGFVVFWLAWCVRVFEFGPTPAPHARKAHAFWIYEKKNMNTHASKIRVR